MTRLERIIGEHPFFAGLEDAHIQLLGGCARNVRFDAGAYLFREGEPADWFYLLREGRVVLEIQAPVKGPVAFETLNEGDVLGASWLVPPYRWSFDARAVSDVRALALDGACLRGKCDQDHHLGYALMTRFVPVMIQRLQATRMQILDLYGEGR